MPENDPYVSPFKWTKGNLKKPPTECAVCSAPAIYSYVGVIVCPSCKVFFKRNAQNEQVSFSPSLSPSPSFLLLETAQMSFRWSLRNQFQHTSHLCCLSFGQMFRYWNASRTLSWIHSEKGKIDSSTSTGLTG